jgi:Zn-dependent protease with chaperone function
MHAQTDRSAPRGPIAATAPFPAVLGFGLYLLTLAVEALLGAGARWLLVYLGASVLGAIVPLGPGAGVLAWLAALLPLAYSVCGLILPGRASLWRLRLGSRRPSDSEDDALRAGLELLGPGGHALARRVAIGVIDDPLPNAAVRGRAIIVSRGLLESASLPAVLAHELAHARGLDGRLSEALGRLVLWADPLGPARREGEIERRDEAEPDPQGRLLWSLARLLARLAGGGCAEQLLAPLWAPYWRTREYAADAYAAALGQGEDLATHLADFEQPFDIPQRGLLRLDQHPPIAFRIERLLALANGGSK